MLNQAHSLPQLQAVMDLSVALYDEPELARARLGDGIAALLGLEVLKPGKAGSVGSPGWANRISRAVLHQAKASQADGVSRRSEQGFYRLSLEERAVLSLLERSGWSYEQIAQVLQIEAPAVERLAWSARLELATSTPTPMAYPIGTPHRAADCPEYSLDRPWPQRLIDDELGAQEHQFISRHCESCPNCQGVIRRARAMIYGVAGQVPQAPESWRAAIEKQVHRQAPQNSKHWPSALWRGMVRVSTYRDVRWLVIGILAWIVSRAIS
jgi:hypothetical protein